MCPCLPALHLHMVFTMPVSTEFQGPTVHGSSETLKVSPTQDLYDRGNRSFTAPKSHLVCWNQNFVQMQKDIHSKKHEPPRNPVIAYPFLFVLLPTLTNHLHQNYDIEGKKIGSWIVPFSFYPPNLLLGISRNSLN